MGSLQDTPLEFAFCLLQENTPLKKEPCSWGLKFWLPFWDAAWQEINENCRNSLLKWIPNPVSDAIQQVFPMCAHCFTSSKSPGTDKRPSQAFLCLGVKSCSFPFRWSPTQTNELFSRPKEMLFLSLFPLAVAPGRDDFVKFSGPQGPVAKANLRMALAHSGQEIQYHGVNFQLLHRTQISEEIHC